MVKAKTPKEQARAEIAAGPPQQRSFNIQVLFAMLGAKEYDLNEAHGNFARLQGQLRQAQARIAELEAPLEEASSVEREQSVAEEPQQEG